MLSTVRASPLLLLHTALQHTQPLIAPALQLLPTSQPWHQPRTLPALLHRLLKALTSLLPTVLNTVQLQVLVPMTQQLTLLNTLPLHQQVHMVQQLTLLLIALVPRQ